MYGPYLKRGVLANYPPATPRPLVRPAYLQLTLRELYDLMRAQSTHALEFARWNRLEIPRANH
jgi:hypothetical protein